MACGDGRATGYVLLERTPCEQPVDRGLRCVQRAASMRHAKPSALIEIRMVDLVKLAPNGLMAILDEARPNRVTLVGLAVAPL